MVFQQTEVIYYACVFLFGSVGGLGRYLFDKSPTPSGGSLFGSLLASGIFSAGSVGIWIGHNPNAVVGPMYFLAVSLFVGYFTPELVAYAKNIFKSVIRAILKRVFGIEVEE
jgi:hypothetical protein